MAKIRVTVAFRGRVTMMIDGERHRHYFKPGYGGWDQLIEDVFYDEAELTGYPFEDGSSVFESAYFDDPEEARD